MSEADVMNIADLNDFNLDAVEAKVRRSLPPGKYMFAFKECGLESRTNNDDVDVVDCNLKLEVARCMGFDKTNDENGNPFNEDDFVGAVTGKTFWTLTAKSLPYLKGFLTNIIGLAPSGPLPDYLNTLETEDFYFVGRIKHRKNKDDPSSPYTEIREEPEHLISHAQLGEEGLLP